MIKRLIYIAPLHAGIVIGIFNGFYTLMSSLSYLFHQLHNLNVGGAPGSGSIDATLSAPKIALLILVLPIAEALFGFIGGVVAAAIFNLIAKKIGGVEFKISEETPTTNKPTS